jgi:hypothetical protein
MSESTNSAVKSAPDPAPRKESAVAQAPARVAWRHIALFALLSYAIAWALILPFIPNVFDLISADKTPAELDISIVPVFAMFAPMVAALVMRLFVSKEGLKGSLGPVRKWRFYGLALVVPLRSSLSPLASSRPPAGATSRGTRTCRCRSSTSSSPSSP